MRWINAVLFPLVLWSVPIFAAITTTGDTDPLYAGGDPWDVGGDLVVGWDAIGTLSVTSGSDLLTDQAYVGYDYTGDGTATISGSGSTWDNFGELWVGGTGLGDLFIEQGALGIQR